VYSGAKGEERVSKVKLSARCYVVLCSVVHIRPPPLSKVALDSVVKDVK